MKKAITTAYNANSTLSGLATLYLEEIKSNASMPYVVYHITTATPVMMQNYDYAEEGLVTFSIWATTDASRQSVYNALLDCFRNQIITEGSKKYFCLLVNLVTGKEDKVWFYHADFEITRKE